jgi:hypothetical protein
MSSVELVATHMKQQNSVVCLELHVKPKSTQELRVSILTFWFNNSPECDRALPIYYVNPHSQKYMEHKQVQWLKFCSRTNCNSEHVNCLSLTFKAHI